MLDYAPPALREMNTAKSAGFSGLRLGRLRAALERHVGEGRIPGMVAAVFHRGREHVETIGTMGFDCHVPMRRDALFRLASTTKPITAVGAMILVEECRLRLDDPVDQWLPELSNRTVLRTIESPLEDTVPVKRPITLRDLLTFRSGYGEVFFLAPASPLQQALVEARLPLSEWPFAGSNDEFMQRLGRLPLAHQPGERWLYHMSAEILGVLIARVAGQSLGEFLRDRIFEPLGMTDTGFRVPETELDRLPPGYGTDLVTGRLGELYQAGRGYCVGPTVFESGAGGLVSTADDLLAFGRSLLGNREYAGERILSRPTIELMTRDHLPPEQKEIANFFPHFWENRGWGLGLSVITARHDIADAPGRFGWDGAFGTSWYVDPKEELVGVLLMQRRPDQLAIPPIVFDFWNSVYQLIED
jgi:CubicO group peptidase (beta-lactamase class C family)